MLSSDDEAEVVNSNVINYHFVDVKEEPICFSVLPFQWEEGNISEGDGNVIFLRGETTDGLQKIFIKVTAWKLELEGVHPEIYVCTKNKIWVKLLKPRKSFESITRKISITIECLHYMKKNPESSEKSLWDHVRKVFSHYEDRPSIYDLIDHERFIRLLIDKGKILPRPQLLLKLLDMKSGTNVEEDINNKNSDFINDDDEKGDAFPYMDATDDSDDDEGELYESVCAICDNGGEVLTCEGRCLRSFHAFKEVSSEDSNCKTLGYSSKKAVDDIKRFLCPNCRWNKHQCFACGKLGSSAKSSEAEVFRCVSATCGYFYHPQCAAKLLHPENDKEAAAEEHKIAAGQMFICPVHKCCVCKQGEDKKIAELQFAMCRRCPTSYHRKCLPREIVFAPSDSDSDSEEAEEEQTHRAWNNLLKNRILLYCLKHDIDPDLGTPKRNHLIFPKDPLAGEKRPTKRKEENLTREEVQDSVKLKKLKTSTAQKKSSVLSKPQNATLQNEITVEQNSKLLLKRDMKQLKSVQRDFSLTQSKPKVALSSASLNLPTSVVVIDNKAKERIMSLLRKTSSSSLTLDDFVKKKFVPSTHAYSARHIDKSITLGKVEGSIEALKTALQKVDEESGSLVNAKDVCEPAMVNQIIKWRNKLAIYLSPFLHGLLYTSFGRHFTKVDILEEIVGRLHWYVKSGDMIVDFCCGANDFSILMNKKLEATGKKCFYRNYDVIPPKNDFNFVKKDWMTVQPNDLPPGSRLIMGLNPPFGFKAALANKFIDKALEFKPKLLILIVPRETQRLDVKRGTKYDLIWEDDKKLSGKAFYLPGTVDVNDKQLEQWNVQPPPLSLWSRHDWTTSHMEIAVNCHHRDPLTGATTLGLQAEHIQSSTVADKAEPLQGKDESEMMNNISSNCKKLESNSTKKKDLEYAGSKLQNAGKPPKKSSNSSKKFDRNELSVRGDGESSDMSISPGRSGSQNLSDHFPLAASEVPKIPSDFRSTFGKPKDTNSSGKRNDVSVSSNTACGREASLPRNLGAAGDIDHYTERPDVRAQGYGSDDGFDIKSRYALDRSSADDVRSHIRPYGQHDSFDLSRSRMIHSDASSGLTQANNLSSIYGFPGANAGRLATERHPQRLDELYAGPAGSVGGLSTMDKYAPRLDEVNSRLLNINPSSAVPSSSVMDRHAPRLDEMNQTRRNTTPDILLSDRGGIYGSSAPWSGPSYNTNPTGFSTGWPYPPPHQGTSGWIDD